ncbi:MAG: hypothetical protein AB2417_11130 [Clostridiaceae bacterium]
MKKKIFFITPIVIVILVCTYFFIRKNYVVNRHSLKYYTKKINEINSGTNSLIKGDSINIDKSKEELPKIISELVIVKNTLDSLTPSDKEIKLKNDIIKGVNNNIHIYEQLLSIFNNPKGKDIDKSCDNVKKYKNECLKYYPLEERSLKYIELSISHIEGLIRENKDKEIHHSHYKDFIDNLDGILSSFIEIKIDFLSYRDDINDNKLTYDEVINTLDYVTSEFEEVKSNFSKISVPNQGVECYKLFSKILDYYSSYLKSFEYAINKELESMKNDSSITVANSNYLYTESNLNYKLMNSNYNDFIKIYLDFKKENEK